MKTEFLVALGVSPAIELGILLSGTALRYAAIQVLGSVAGRQDADLYGRRDACRYMFKTRGLVAERQVLQDAIHVSLGKDRSLS